VSREITVCPQWYHDFNTNMWGCLTWPQYRSVAGGAETDKYIQLLQKEIVELQSRVAKLETNKR